MKFDIFIALRYIKAKRRGLFAIITTLIAVAGVAVGVGAMLTTLSVMNGFQEDIRSKIIGAQAHIIMFGNTSRESYGNLKNKLLEIDNVEAAAPIVYGQAILTFKSRTSGLLVRGLDPEEEVKINTLHNSFTHGGWEPKAKEGETNVPPAIVVGEELARNMNLWLEDDLILVSPQSVSGLGMLPKMKKFRVSGLIKTGYYEFDNTMAYTKIDDASDFFGMKGAYSGIQLKLKNLDKAQKVAEIIKPMVGFRYSVRTFMQLNKTLYSALKLEKFMMFLILGLIILVASLNISSNLILLSAEKMRDIGILRAMGAPPARIRGIFWWEGLFIATMGIVLGILFGLTLCFIIANFNIVELPSDIYYITKVPVSIKIKDILTIVGASYILCFAATLYPAIRCSRINPVDAIRHG